MAAPPTERSWTGLAVAVLAALLTIAAGDFLVRLAVPTSGLGLREVEDGLADLWRKNPDILVLGSSHARTFHVVGQQIEKRTRGAVQVVSIPLEMGRAVPYLWLLNNRLKPAIDDTDADGRLRHDHLKHFVLLTEWWDVCPADGVYGNLPSRAWGFRHFVRDVLANGLNEYNRNYLQRRWQRFWGNSVFNRLRKSHDYTAGAARMLGGAPLDDREEKTRSWQSMVEGAAECVGDPEQMHALSKVVEFAKKRRLSVTVVLFPRKPGTFTARARQTTLLRMRRLMTEFTEARGVRLVDLTLSSPLTDDDFMADFDHVDAQGNEIFARWVLDHDLRYLLPDQSGDGVGGAE